jgi:hypothetical protein
MEGHNQAGNLNPVGGNIVKEALLWLDECYNVHE